MTKLRAIRVMAVLGLLTSATAYVMFVQLHLNGDDWWQKNKLWATVVMAEPPERMAWVSFFLFGLAAFALRSRLGKTPIIASAVLVVAPVVWIVFQLSEIASETRGDWMWGNWRWFMAQVYAEFAVGLCLGFGSVLALTVPVHRSGPP